MNIDLAFKKQLHTQLVQLLDEKIKEVQTAMVEVSESMKNDTKSSAGDKFETGREMMQIELNNNQQQLNKFLKLKNDVSQIDPEITLSTVSFGSLVHTSLGIYFFSVALGKVMAADASCYALSMASPVGQALMDKRVGEKVEFQGREISILKIV